MKKFLLSLLCLFSMAAMQAETAWVTLNNGNIIKGDVTTTDSRVTITTAEGRTYSYSLAEVHKISYTEPVTPAVTQNTSLKQYTDTDRGFWMRAQVIGAYTIFLNDRCAPLAEFDVAGGYRFSQYLKAGVGIGIRSYFDNDRLRGRDERWSMPVFATVEGNIIDETYRTVVPYYSLDLGGAVRDGFMVRPGVGLRIGSSRSAFLIGINYIGQSLKYRTGKDRFVSAAGISIGYEF